MKRILIIGLSLGIVSLGNASVIGEIMKKYHKGDTSLSKKVQAGKGSDADLATLLKAYQNMAAAKPSKGDASSWDTKCKALINSIEAFQKKDPNAVSKYKMAVACKSCHEVHKK
jgi:hypothetical protein